MNSGCEICEGWTHSVCINISVDVYNVLYKNADSRQCGFKWFCDQCNKKMTEAIDKLVSIETKTKNLEKEMETVKEKVTKLEKTSITP